MMADTMLDVGRISADLTSTVARVQAMGSQVKSLQFKAENTNNSEAARTSEVYNWYEYDCWKYDEGK